MKKISPKKETVVVELLQRIKDEIKHYPTPIAGCDEPFPPWTSAIDEKGRNNNYSSAAISSIL